MTAKRHYLDVWGLLFRPSTKRELIYAVAYMDEAEAARLLTHVQGKPAETPRHPIRRRPMPPAPGSKALDAA